jgi:hypothetical protein
MFVVARAERRMAQRQVRVLMITIQMHLLHREICEVTGVSAAPPISFSSYLGLRVSLTNLPLLHNLSKSSACKLLG